MAELSFGHNLRAKRKEVVNNTLSFLPWAQGCFTGCAPVNNVGGAFDMPSANTVHFNNAPAKMLGIALHEYGSSHQFKVQLCNLPREIRDNEVLVQVQATSVNPTDCKLRSGRLQELYPLSLPVILGCDLAGVVVKAGPSAPFSPGQHVFGRQTLDRLRELAGTYAEFCVVDGAELCEKPASISFEEAAAIPYAGLAAMAALTRTGGIGFHNTTGSRRAVLIFGGSGGVGSLAVQIAKHHLRCHVVATCSAANAARVKALGADEVVDYNLDGFLARINRPELGAGKSGFSMVLDCVGGDDYWETAQALMAEGGVYVTLVGPERYGGEGQVVSVGSAFNTQLTSGLRKGLGMLGASRRYTVLTPSACSGEDLGVLAGLLEEGKIKALVTKTYSMYDIIDAHEHIETHHAVGKCIIQVRKGLPEEDEDQGSEPDEDDTGVDLKDMVLDKATMRLVPRGQEGKGGLDADLKKKQMEVAARMKKMKEANDAKQAAARGPVPGEEDLTAEDRAWMEANGMMGIVGETHGAGGAGVGAGGKGAGGARGKKATEEEMRKKTVSFGVNEEQTFEAPSPDVTGPGAAFAAAAAAKLSKREQYRVAVMQAKEELEEDKAALNMEEGGSRASNTEAPPGGVSHAGVLRKKKQDHGRFEDPYRQTFVADLEDGILTLRLTKDGEVTGEEESYNLGEGWKLTAREDKKDRFTLVRSGPKMDSADPDEVTLRATSKAEGELWIHKLAQTAQWFGELGRRRGGTLAGRPPTQTQPREDSDPHGFSGSGDGGGGGAAEQAGVGMVLKQTQGTLVVKKMTDGAPAAASEQIEVGDVLLKVDGKKVSTAEQAAQLILGDVGSSVSLLVERDIEGRKVKFPLTLKRGKPPGK